ASQEQIGSGLGHAILQGFWIRGNNVMRGARYIIGKLKDTIRGLAIASNNVVKAMGAEGAELHDRVLRWYEDSSIRFGYVKSAFTKVSRNLTDKDWEAVKPYHDLELSAEQQHLKPIGAEPHPDVADLPPLSPEQITLQRAMSTYTRNTIADIIKATGWDYARAQEEFKSWMQEGVKELGPKFSPKT